MDFVLVMLFIQKVFHLGCLLLFFQIKSQPGVAYKYIDCNKAFNVVFQSSTNEEIAFPYEFIFVFILYFIGAILLEKCSQKQGVWKEYKKGGRPYRGLSMEGGFKPSTHWYWKTERGDLGALNYCGDLNWRGDLIWKGDLRPIFIPWFICISCLSERKNLEYLCKLLKSTLPKTYMTNLI